VLSQEPQVVDLELSDGEYLELLAQGRDPVREQSYTKELIAFGFTTEYTAHVVPLFDKAEGTIAEKILVNRTLRCIWEHLLKQVG
jgi:hypothetical protein